MSQVTLQEWEEKIAKLMAKAEDPSVGDAERQAFLGKAEELVSKYRLEWGRIQQAMGKLNVDEIAIIERQFVIALQASHVKEWKVRIFNSICELLGTELLTYGSLTVCVIGTEKSVEHSEAIYSRVSKFIEAEYEAAAAQAYIDGIIGRGYGKIHGRTFKTQFLNSAAKVIQRRVAGILADREIEKLNAKPASEVIALAVVDTEVQKALTQFMQKEYPKLNSRYFTSDTSTYSRDADHLGRSAGERAPLQDRLNNGD